MQAVSRRFRNLIVWRKAHEAVLAIYQLTSAFPQKEVFALSQQMRHAAVSIPANIAEGFTRRGKIDKARFVNIAESALSSGAIWKRFMYNTKANGPINAHADDKNTAHAMRIKRRPSYIGFRVTL